MTDDIPRSRRSLAATPGVGALKPARRDDSGDEDPQAVPRWPWRRRRKEAEARRAAELRRQRARQAADQLERRQRQDEAAAALRRQLQHEADMSAEPQRHGDPDREADREAGS
jgi:hypothetical protein